MVENNSVTDVAHHVFDVVRWHECEISLTDCTNEEDIHSVIREALIGLQEKAQGKVLALRLLLSGTTALHRQLLENSSQWMEECKGIAAGLGEIWLEQIRIQTEPTESHLIETDQDTVLGTLLQTISALDVNESSLQALVPELSALKNKLPPPLNRDSVTSLFADEENPEILINEVRELLLSRFTHRGES